MEEMNSFDEALTALEKVPQSGSIEVYVDTAFVKNLPQVLNNLSEVEEWVKRQTANDRNLVVTSENEEEVKARCAELNKLTEQIEAKRKQVKKAYQAPLALFESKCKAVVAALQEPKDHLWGQIKAADERRKDEKRAALLQHYREAIGDNYGYTPWERIEKSAWLTKGARLETVYKELDEIAEGVRADIEAITNVAGNDSAALLVEYKRGKTLTEVLKYYEVLKTQREQQARAAAERAQSKPQEPQTAAQETPSPVQQEERVYAITLHFRMTRAQARKLSQFLSTNNIYYTKDAANNIYYTKDTKEKD